MEWTAGAPVAATLSPVTGLVTFLSTNPQKPIFLDVPASADAEVRARVFLDDFGAAFGVGDSRQLTLRHLSGLDEVGMEHVRFQQTHGGVPVTGGELTVHLRGASVVAVNAKSLPDLEGLTITPTLTVPDARAKAQDALARRLGVTAAELSEPRLEFFNRGIFDGTRFPTRLAWFVEATGIELREYLWIDAETGMLLLEFSQLTHARDRKIYDAASGSVLPGTLVRSEGGPPTGDADEDAAYRLFRRYLRLFFHPARPGQLRRCRGDNHLFHRLLSEPCARGLPVRQRFLERYADGLRRRFPGGGRRRRPRDYPRRDRVYGQPLQYYMQSGALNESFSDIFGETVDLTNTGGTDTPAVRWLMGEDVPVFGAIRDMMDPTAFGDPGKVSDSEFFCGDDYRLGLPVVCTSIAASPTTPTP